MPPTQFGLSPHIPQPTRAAVIAAIYRPHTDLTPQRAGVLTAALLRLQGLSGAAVAALPFQARDREVLARVLPAGCLWLAEARCRHSVGFNSRSRCVCMR
ncbi:MAG: hypothetical protein HC926_02440 [Synechococcaceae cyanobacterium SM2_3_60]|nr:hypothetical protein [Synechococcaceae cyanobacterium SM2_3_60]